MSKRPIWLDDISVEVVSGYVAKLLDDHSGIPDYDRTILDDVMHQLHELQEN